MGDPDAVLSAAAHLDALLVATDVSSVVTVWSPGSAAMLGWTAEEAVGRSSLDLGIAPPDQELASELAQRVLSGATWEGTFPVRRKSGGEILIRFTASPMLDGDGKIVGLVALGRHALRPDDERERAEARLHLMARAGTLLARSLEPTRVIGDVADLLVPSFVDHCHLDLLNESGEPVRVVARDAGNALGAPEAPGSVARYPEGHPARRVLDGEPGMLLSDRPGLGSLVVVPLRIAGRAVGQLSAATSAAGRELSLEDYALLEEIAGRLALALDHAAAYRHERETTITLQRALLPSRLPSLDGVHAAWRYEPATAVGHPREDREDRAPGEEETPWVGGDWFDLIPLSSGRCALVIGDVQGRGPWAAAVMGQLRTAVRSYAELDMPPADLLWHLDALVRSLGEDLLATCLYLEYDPFLRTCRAASAGHLRPLRTTAGTAVPLEVPVGAPLGSDETAYAEVELPIPAGTLLCLFTDGLVEERAHDIGDGLQQVVDVLSLASDDEDLEALADRVMSGRPEVADDRALLLVRLGEASLASAVHALPCDPAAAGAARTLVSQVLDTWGCAHLADPALLVTSEFVSNAVRHSRQDADGRGFLLHLRCGAHAIWVEVHDADPRLPSPRRTSALDDGGRGLQIVDVIARRWGARRTSTGKALWAELTR